MPRNGFRIITRHRRLLRFEMAIAVFTTNQKGSRAKLPLLIQVRRVIDEGDANTPVRAFVWRRAVNHPRMMD